MNIFRFTLPATVLFSLFLLQAFPSFGHEIHLKNGKVIKTDSIEKTEDSIRYELYGGTITINTSEVEKIVYSQTRKKEDKPAEPTAERHTRGDKDLEALLKDKLHPKTPIERANMATLSVQTHAGSGSGFFINDQGFIITNRHVVRGSEEQADTVSEKLQDVEQDFESARKQLELEQNRIASYERRLEGRRQEIKEARKTAVNRQQKRSIEDAEAELRSNEEYLAEWQNDYNQRIRTFELKKSEFINEKSAYHNRLSKLSNQQQFTIILADGSEKYASLYRISDTLDLALLKLNGFKTPFLKPAMRSEQALGQPVYAIGAPLNLANSVTSGVLSSYRGEFVQTNAEIYPGNSGGPLVNEAGEVLGVNTMKLITEKFEGLGFAIQIEKALKEFGDFL